MSTNIYVVFGAAVRPDGSPSGTLYRRTLGAWEFAQQQEKLHHTDGLNSTFIVSGAIGTYPPSEADVMTDILLSKGVFPDYIIKDDKAKDTVDTVDNAIQIIQTIPNINKYYVCTSPYHTWRCQILFRLNKLPFHRAKMPGDLPQLGIRKWLFYCFKELVAIPWDTFVVLKNS